MTSSSGPRLISDLGLETHQQYAKNQKELAPHLLQDAQAIQGKLEISVISPARPLDTQFEIGYTTIWAVFDESTDAAAGASFLFIHLMVPSLGGADKLSEQLDQLKAAPKPEPLLIVLLQQQLNDEETYRLVITLEDILKVSY